VPASSQAVECIAAVATGWAPSDRAVIRLSGSGTRVLCEQLFTSIPISGGMIVRTSFHLTQTLPLPCLLMRFDDPRSYTGEDGAEIVLPGNPLVLERVVARLLAQQNVREAQPGEFSARAYLNGRMTLAQAEGVAALIAAGTEDQLAAASSLMSGRTGERHRAWADRTASLLALVESGIDFTDQEDVIPIAPALLVTRLGALIAEMLVELGSTSGVERAASLPRVALVGLPNAGKSTLFNALLGRRRAMVSPVAGTTRDAIVETLDLSGDVSGGPSVELVDLAGLDTSIVASSRVVDQHAQRQARDELQRADVLVLCDPLGRFGFEAIISAGRSTLRVRTKADLPLAASAQQDTTGQIGVCALDGWNLAILRRAIADVVSATRHSGGTWMLPRHRRSLAAARDGLSVARAAINTSAPSLGHPELIAGDLRLALDHLGELVGEISPDDVIGRVFATFCVGK
jgi:tRNA modification GTPase